MSTIATDVDRAVARLEADIERVSPMLGASVAAPKPQGARWRVVVHLRGLGRRSDRSPFFTSEADALAFREAAHDAIGRAT